MKHLRWAFVATCVGALLAFAAGATAAGGVVQWHDFTEGQTGSVEADYAVVTFKDPAAASYEGGIQGYERTKPERGRLDPNGKAVRAYLTRIQKEHDDFRGWMKKENLPASVVREYALTTNAVAVELNGTGLDALAKGPDVKSVERSAVYHPVMNVSAGLIRADVAWGAAGGRANGGAGIKVGIIDSGIQSSHPFFACKAAIQGAIPHKVFASGEAFRDPSQDIVLDHGTHVSGTVAGCVTTLTSGPLSGRTLSGIAPAAKLYDYDVFPGWGGAFRQAKSANNGFSHDIAAAVEAAVADGMDVINLSIGGKVQGPHDSLAEALNGAVDAGVVAAVAAGNEGPGRMTVGSPGTAEKVITVGAFTNAHYIGIPVASSKGNFGAATGDFNPYTPAVGPVQYTTTTPADGCTAISTNVTGKIALIDRGTCFFSVKIRNAQTAGAVGVLVVNNTPGDPSAMGSDGLLSQPTIPAAMVSDVDGAAMKPDGTVTVDGANPTEILTNNGKIIAGFSSRGPTPFTYLVKPDVMAPGVNIYSSVFNGEYEMFQGTSMATPHVTGSAALLLQAHPTWTPQDVKSALANTAVRDVSSTAGSFTDAGILSRGAGRVDVPNASAAGVSFAPSSVSFGLFNGNRNVAGSTTVTAKNLTGSTQSCSVAKTGNGRFAVAPASVTIAANGTASFAVTLSGGNEAQTASGDYSADVVVTCGSAVYQLPVWTTVNREGKP